MGRWVRGAAWHVAAALLAGAELNPVALRMLGQVKPFANGVNLVEGRELGSPQGIAIDFSAMPPRLYVADTGNHRVLGWQDATRFSNGQRADLVIGQMDFFATAPNGPGAPLGLWQPSGLAVDATGSLYIADTGNHRVLRYRQPFQQRIRAPDLVVGQTGLGARERNMGRPWPSEITLAAPLAVALNPRGDLAVADSGNNRVLIFAASSLVSDGPAAAAVLGQATFSEATPGTGLGGLKGPSGLAFDAAGRLYAADTGLNRVLQFQSIATGGVPTRLFGGNPDSAPQGPQTLLRPAGVAIAGEDLFIADTGNHRLLRFSNVNRPEARPVADAIFGQWGFSAVLPNGASRSIPLASAQSLSSPVQIAFGLNQELFVADAGNHRVLAIPSTDGSYQAAARVLGQDNFTANASNLVEGREVSTFHVLAAPGGGVITSGGIVVDASASPPCAYVADTANHRVLGWRDARSLRDGQRADLAIGQPDLETTVANYGAAAADSRPAGPANLNRPSGLALDSSGNLFVADTGNHRVLRFPRPFGQTPGPVRADLAIGQPALAGSPVQGASAFLLQSPTGIAVHPERGDLLVADTLNHRVLYFTAPLSTGMAATRVFGQTSFTESARGLSSATMTLPAGVGFDSEDRVYVADNANSRVLVFGPLRDLPPTGAAALASGATPIGQPDFVTGLGAAAANRLRNPTALWVSWTTGDIWVADTGNHRVLRFPPLAVVAINGGSSYATGGLFGQINFTARTPNLGAAAAGQTSAAGLSFPNAVALDAAGNLLVGDGNARVLLYFPQALSVSAATYLPGAPLAPGMLAALFGADLSEGSAQAGLPLPMALADTEVLVNDVAAPVLFVSPGQINYQVPSALLPGTVAKVEVRRSSSGGAVAGGTFLVAPAAVGIFGVLNQDGSPNTPANPAARGAVVQIFATGQGVVLHAPPDGEPAPAAPLAQTPSRPLVTIGTSSERDVVPEFSGLAPGFVGLWQINARVPEATVPAPRTPLVVRYGGSASNVVYIAVK